MLPFLLKKQGSASARARIAEGAQSQTKGRGIFVHGSVNVFCDAKVGDAVPHTPCQME